MAIAPYRRVLALPGVRALLLVGLVARIPLTGAGITLTLHVVGSQRLGFLQAGLVGAFSMIGTAVGSPLVGRSVDRYGLRPVITATTAAQLCFWGAAPSLPYPALTAGALVAGVFTQPAFGVVRQCLAAAVPPERHQTAFALDSMVVELSYMIGPAVAVASVANFSSRVAMYALGAGQLAAGAALYLLDPPTREEIRGPAEPVPRRSWLGPGLLTLLGAAAGLTFVLTAAELSLVARLQADGAAEWTGMAIALLGASSMAGGFVYGALPRGFAPLTLIAGLCALTIPLGLVPGGWWWLCLALVPGGMLCAPALSATVNVVSRRVPAAARGEAMGLHGTFLTIGVACAGPVAGGVLDASGPGWAFAVCGALGMLMVLIALPFQNRPDRRAGIAPQPAGTL